MITSVYIATTLDGYIAREDGALDWLPGSDGKPEAGFEHEDFGFTDFIKSVDVLVMGRKTYELVLASGQWPYSHLQVIVLSSSLSGLAEHLPDSVEIKSATPSEIYSALKQSGAKHLYIDGGKTIQGFLNADLIDEIIITKVPILIGLGIPLFANINKDIRLKHIKTDSFKNGFVQSHYSVIN